MRVSNPFYVVLLSMMEQAEQAEPEAEHCNSKTAGTKLYSQEL